MKETAIKRSQRRKQRLGGRSLSINRSVWKKAWRKLRNQRKRRKWIRKRSWGQGGRRLIRSQSWNWSQRKRIKKTEEPEKKKKWRHRRESCVLFSTSSTWSSFSSWNSLTSHCSQTESPGQWLAQNGDTIKDRQRVCIREKWEIGKLHQGKEDQEEEMEKRTPLLLLRLLSLFHLLLLFLALSLLHPVLQGLFYKLLCYSLIILVSECVSLPFPPNLQNILLPKPLELETWHF